MNVYDVVVFSVYVLGMMGVALLFYKKNNSFSAMFAASGQSPWWVSGLSSYMTLFSAGTFVVWGGLAYKHGAVAISINIASGCAALLVGFFIASKWKQFDIPTPAAYIETRFGKAALHYYTWMLMLVRILGSAVALYALSNIVLPLLPQSNFDTLMLDQETYMQRIILICGVIIVAYTIIGGLWAVLMTDVLQFIILSVSVLFTLWLATRSVGGVERFMEAAPNGFLDVINQEYSVFFLFGWCAIHLFMLGAEWAFVQRYIAVPSRQDAKRAALLFGGLYVVSPAIWLLPAMIYRTINPDANPEQAYILMSSHVLPLGMLGLVAAAMFSATASMVSSQLNVFSGVLTDEVYRRYWRPNASDKECVWAGRISAAILGMLIITLAIAIPYLGGAEKVIFGLMGLLISPLFAPALLGLFSKRISSSAVWCTAIAAAVVGVILKFGCSESGFLTSFSSMDWLVEWSRSNTRNLDIYIGVVTPVLVLAALHIKGVIHSETSSGWMALQSSQCHASIKLEEQRSDDYLPLLIVTVAVFVCALITLVLTMVNAEHRQEMITLTVSLFTGFFVLLFKVKRPVITLFRNGMQNYASVQTKGG